MDYRTKRHALFTLKNEAFLRRSSAVTAKECTCKVARNVRAKLLFRVLLFLRCRCRRLRGIFVPNAAPCKQQPSYRKPTYGAK